MEATHDYHKDRLLSAVEGLSAREIQMVVLYAKMLKMKPLSEMGQAYIEMLIRDGASGIEILRAAQAVREVDERLAREEDRNTGVAELHQRTDEHFRQWCREHGIDYDSLSEEEFDEIAAQAIKEVRAAH